MRCSWVLDAVDGSVANPAPRRSQRNESTVPIRRVPASRAAATSSECSSSQASLAAEKYGSKGSPLASLTASSSPASRSSTSCDRLSCQTTIGLSGRPLSASQASTDSPWWSSPQATTSPGASASSFGDRLDHRGQHLLAVLLDPAGLRIAVDLVAPRLGAPAAARGRRAPP